MIQYNAAIIQEFADRLYKRANSMVASYTAIGILFGIGIAFSLEKTTDMGTVIFIIGGLLGAIVGFVIGQERAFALKLQAQTTLCQLQIEKNTRVNGK